VQGCGGNMSSNNTPNLHLQNPFVRFYRTISFQILFGILFVIVVSLLLDLPAQISRGEKGQLAIQALDKMRRPFLAIVEVKARTITGLEIESIRNDMENVIAAGYTALLEYQSVTRYNDQLARNVESLFHHYDDWIKVERDLIERIEASAETVTPAEESRLHELISRTSTNFLRTINTLGEGEYPIHLDIDRGRHASHVLLFFFAMLFVYFFSILYYQQYRKMRDLKQAEEEKSRVFYATISATQHILNNLLNNMQLFMDELEDSHAVNDEIIKLLEKSLNEGKELVSKLSSVEDLTEESIKSSVRPISE
jgi:hypothetical protein